MPSVYSSALVVLYVALVVAEFFVPSGGLLGAAAAVAAITAVIIGFTHSVSFGLTILAVLLVLTPVMFVLMVRLWPRTVIGRHMLNRPQKSTVTTSTGPTTLDGAPLQEFVGRFGTARTDLLPSGQVVIDGHKANAISNGQPIDSGSPVKVLKVQASQVQVRIATEEELATAEAEQQQRQQTEVPVELAVASDQEWSVPELNLSPADSPSRLDPENAEPVGEHPERNTEDPSKQKSATPPTRSTLEDIDLDEFNV